MKKRLCSILLLMLLLPLTALPVHADMGPKPSVCVTIQGLEGRSCYATLLSSEMSNGPLHAGKPLEYYGNMTEQEREAGEKFHSYAQQTGGWYFLPAVWDASQGNFAWTYYPPDPFQIALYLPGEDILVISEQCGRYAFDSAFTVSVSGLEAEPGAIVTGIKAAKSYDYKGELVGLAARIILTIMVEAALAVVFHLRGKKQMLLILGVNIVTQVALNVALNLQVYYNGTMLLFGIFLLMEAVVTGVEAVLYWAFMPGLEEHSSRRHKILAYALSANGLSMVIGWLLARLIPGIF